VVNLDIASVATKTKCHACLGIRKRVEASEEEEEGQEEESQEAYDAQGREEG